MMTECSHHLDQSDDTIHLLRCLHKRREQNNKDGRAPITRIKSDFTEKKQQNDNKTVNVANF